MKVSRDQRIMIVEDSDDDYEATERALKRDGRLANELLRFENGEAALGYLLNEPPFEDRAMHPKPGIILLDLNLPGGGGVVALSRIKADATLERIPVVVLTTSTDPTDIARCYAAGANTYVAKPVDVQDFFRAVQRLRDYWFDLAILPGEAS